MKCHESDKTISNFLLTNLMAYILYHLLILNEFLEDAADTTHRQYNRMLM